MNWNNWCLQNWLSVFSDVITPIKWLKERNMKLLHRLWLKKNDIGEYDVKYGAWKIYQIMYTNNLIQGGNLFTDYDIVKKGGRPYIKCQFIHNGKSTEEMRFSGETDFNFSTQKKRELCRSRYENYKKILERDLAGE